MDMDDRLDRAPCGYISLSEDGRLTEINRTLLDLLGYRAGELHAQPVGSILTASARSLFQTCFFPVIRRIGKVEELYLSLLTGTGEEVPVLVNGVRREREGVPAYECILVPVRLRSQLQSDAKQAFELLQLTEILGRDVLPDFD